MLDEHQEKAAMSLDCDHSIMSPAGSGKTTVSIERIKNLIENGIEQKKILFVTFSKKATEEMRGRLQDKIGTENNVYVSTLHSLSFALLKKLTKQKYHVVDEYNKYKIIKNIFIKNKYPEQMLPSVSGKISILKQNEIRPYNYEQVVEFGGELLYDVYTEYEHHKATQFPELIDFEDMMLKLMDVFESDEKHKEAVNKIWDYIIVDEFQDTSTLQFKIIQIISKQKNLYVIGDVNQCIYEWRNAKPEYMQDFHKYRPEAKSISLKNTYRCSKAITEASNALIYSNHHATSATGVDGFFKIYGAENEFNEAQMICEMIKNKHNDRPIKILYRTNAQSMALEIELSKSRIPYKLIGQQQFFNRKEVKDIFAYIDVIHNKPKTLNESWRRIMNRPNRYLGKAFMLQLEQKINVTKKPVLDILKSNAFSHSYMNKGALELYYYVILGEKEDTPKRIYKYIMNSIGYKNYAISQSESSNADESPTDDVLNELEMIISSMNTIEDLLNVVYVKTSTVANVELMTIHKSKGLEADIVFIIGVCSGILPHQLSEREDEEKRLLYVAITRAKEGCYIISPSNYFGKRRRPSMFLDYLYNKTTKEQNNEV